MGLAKALALNLFGEEVAKYGDDGLASADVSLNNLQSQAVMNSLHGEPGWIVYW